MGRVRDHPQAMKKLLQSRQVFSITLRNKALTLSEIHSFKALRFFFSSDCWACKEKQQQTPNELIPVCLISAKATSSVAQSPLEILHEGFI